MPASISTLAHPWFELVLALCFVVGCSARGSTGTVSPPSADSGAMGVMPSAGATSTAGATSSAGSPSFGGDTSSGGGTSSGGDGSAGNSDSGADAGAGSVAGSSGAGTPAVLSEACTAAVAPPTDGYQAITVNGEMRRFLLHLPATYDGKHPFPAITTYHSKGDGATQWDSVKFYYKVAAGATNVLVYMEALADPTLAGDLSFERNPSDDLAYVDAVVAWLRQNVCFDTSRLFALGHSNGATFVQDLGCHRSDVFRAIAMHAGNAGDMTGCGKPIPAWVSFGDGDNAGLIAISKARRDFWAKANGCSATTAPADPAPCVTYTGCTSSQPVEFCEDTAGDHKWSAWMSAATATFFARF